MINTNPDMRAEIAERLIDGDLPSSQEVEDLLRDAARGEELEDIIDQVSSFLRGLGYALIDITTDDDDGTVMELTEIGDQGEQ